MAEEQIFQDDFVTIEPNGRIIIPEQVMEAYVIDTPGCKIWLNEKSGALGLRLLRGVEDPPYLIERMKEEGSLKGVLEAGRFLAKVGFSLGRQAKRYPIRYYKRYRMIEIRGENTGPKHGPSGKEVLLDFPALEDD